MSQSEKLFVVRPGTIISVNDWQEHYVGSFELMRLFQVRPSECVVIDDPSRGLPGYDVEQLLAEGRTLLEPRVTGLYTPATDVERDEIRRKLRASSACSM